MSRSWRQFSALCAALALAGPAGVLASPLIDGCAVFPANNVWNTPIDGLPVHASSATWVGTIGSAAKFHPDFGTFYLGSPIGIPFITVPGTQPLVGVVFDVPEESDAGPYPIPPAAPVEGDPPGDGDRHVLVVDRDHCVLYELDYAFKQPDNSWTAFSGAVFDLTSNALRTDTWTSADAAGLPILPGLIRYDEYAAGSIDHAIRFTAPQTRKLHVWPARHDASDLTGAQYPPMGARFRLKGSVDENLFLAANRPVIRALKKYGMILADNGSSWFASGAHDTRWDDDVLSDLKVLQGSDFEAVDTSAMIVDPDSGAAQNPSAPTLTGVKSRKTHGLMGTYDVAIDPAQPPTGSISVEPRAIGSGHRIVFQVSAAVTSTGGATTTLGSVADVSASGTEVQVTLTAIPDNRRVTVTLLNVNGSGANFTASVGFLVGDEDNTRSVSNADIALVKGQAGQVIAEANAKMDVNLSGAVTSADILSAKGRSGLAIP